MILCACSVKMSKVIIGTLVSGCCFFTVSYRFAVVKFLSDLHLYIAVQMRGVTPLHMAADLNNREGVVITKMLLTCLVNADTRALDDGTYLHLNLVFPFAVMTSVFF